MRIVISIPMEKNRDSHFCKNRAALHLAHEDNGKTARPIRLAMASFSSQKVIFCFSFVGECPLHPVLFVLCVSFCFTD